MIYLLVFLKVLEELILIMLIINVAKPAHRIVVGFSLLKVVMLQGKLDEFCVTLHHSKKEGHTIG